MVQSEAIPVLLASRGCRRLHPDREVETEDSGGVAGSRLVACNKGLASWVPERVVIALVHEQA